MLTPNHPRLLRLPDVLARVPYSRSHLWRMEREGTFPRRIKLGANRVAWAADEIQEWITSRIRARDDAR
ncbi:MAG: AlpA family phage regulatory protein [Planctomycetota bacterium]|nr:AlpA family phage regulatory protein [Planctomycetota bacterium]